LKRHVSALEKRGNMARAKGDAATSFRSEDACMQISAIKCVHTCSKLNFQEAYLSEY